MLLRSRRPYGRRVSPVPLDVTPAAPSSLPPPYKVDAGGSTPATSAAAPLAIPLAYPPPAHVARLGGHVLPRWPFNGRRARQSSRLPTPASPGWPPPCRGCGRAREGGGGRGGLQCLPSAPRRTTGGGRRGTPHSVVGRRPECLAATAAAAAAAVAVGARQKGTDEDGRPPSHSAPTIETQPSLFSPPILAPGPPRRSVRRPPRALRCGSGAGVSADQGLPGS